jgi:hypothetical protein
MKRRKKRERAAGPPEKSDRGGGVRKTKAQAARDETENKLAEPMLGLLPRL